MTCFKKIKWVLFSLLVMMVMVITSFSILAQATELAARSAIEVTLHGNEKLLLKLAEAHVTLVQSNSAKLKITLREGDALNVEVKNGVIQIMSLDQDVFVTAGNNSKRKNSVIEISGPSLSADVHVYEGLISFLFHTSTIQFHTILKLVLLTKITKPFCTQIYLYAKVTGFTSGNHFIIF